jgi:DNA-binding transcriptional ArsR family regulator
VLDKDVCVTEPWSMTGAFLFASARKKKIVLPLDIFLYRNMISIMARAATTTDVFNAIAEPRRREVIAVLADGKEYAVGEVVLRLKMPQPAVSKHLGVLRKVGVVSVIKRGQHRMYRLNAAELKPVYDWVKVFERYWTHQLDQIKERAEKKALQRMISDAKTKG